MAFSIISSIKKRTSKRTYKGCFLSDSQKAEFTKLFGELPKAPFGTDLQFQIVTTKSDKSEKVRLGTYGFIQGATDFIVGVMRPDQKLEDYGYLLEYIILYATNVGLGTCWLGGSFSSSNFAKAVELQDDHIIPAVTPIGEVKDKRGLVDRFIRWSAKSHTRKEWERMFFLGDLSTPLEKDQGHFTTALEMLRLAPSASNKQPWKVIKDKEQNSFHFYLKRTPSYDKTLRRVNAYDLQRIDLGIAMCHFEQSLIELGVKGHFEEIERPVPGVDFQYIASWKEE